jgi:suppressor for copper-sensitivity B
MLGASATAHAAASDWVGDTHAAVRLISGVDGLGSSPTIEAGLEFRFAPGWHGYWRTPGDSGIAPMLDWSRSENIDRENVAWPAPTRLVIEGLQNGTYENHVVLPVTLALKTPARPTRIRLAIGYGACSNICVPYQAELSLALAVGSAGASPEAPLIAVARAKVPDAPAAAGIEVVSTGVVETGSETNLVVELRSKTEPFLRPDLFVEGIGAGLPPSPKIELSEGGHAARLTTRLPDSLPASRPLTLTLIDGSRAAEFAAIAKPPVTKSPMTKPPILGPRHLEP